MRSGLAAILRAVSDHEVVGEACDGAEAIALAETTRPDVVLMDVMMPEVDGITATHRMLASGNEKPPRVLILTAFDTDENVYRALRAGASGFILKDTPPEHLVHAIQAVADGEALFSPTVTRRLVEAYCGPGDEIGVPQSTAGCADELQRLTEREKEVVRLVGTGLANAEIAERLVVSEGTVKTHLNRAMAKLHLSSRAQTVVLAYESGLVSPGRHRLRLSAR